MTKLLTTVFLAAVLLAGCSNTARQTQQAQAVLKTLEAKYAPDKRVAVFDVTARVTKMGLIVKGDVGSADEKRELLGMMREIGPFVVDSVDVLPEKNVGDLSRGIVTLSVANMRSKPQESAELSSQVLMGSVVKILKKHGGWYYVQSPDDYLGWVEDDSFWSCTPKDGLAWADGKNLIVTAIYDRVMEQPDPRALPVCDVVAGAILRLERESGAWYAVALADGRKGYLLKGSGVPYDAWKKSIRPTAEGIERVARSLIGVPYLWGGTSTKGVDCSGFTRTAFLLNGLLLNRDADEQAQQGVEVDPGDKFANLRKADLLFFGRKGSADRPERIAHVGIYLGNRLFIHSSGRVRISSFDPASPIYDAYDLRRFVRARRILPAAPGIAEVSLR